MFSNEPPDIGDNVEIEWTRCEDCDLAIVCRDDEPALCVDCRATRDQWASDLEARIEAQRKRQEA